jgi:hypothetical protein
MELSQDAPQPADHSLRDAIVSELLRLRPNLIAMRTSATTGGLEEVVDQACRDQADAVVQLLIETGHVIPGAPPAEQILADAKSFAARLTLSNLALRILNMLAWSNVETPESKPARRWLEDYLEGKNHGPVGQPMLWPGKLPGLCHLLREWGFMPTIAQPGQASYVARAVQAPRVQ